MDRWLPDGSVLVPDGISYYGTLGDYIGGVWGSALAVLTTILIAVTLYISTRQYKRSEISSTFSEILDSHDSIVESLNLSTTAARDVFAEFLSEFYQIYQITAAVNGTNGSWSVDERIDIAYTFMSMGPQITASNALRHYGEVNIKSVHDRIHQLRASGVKFTKNFKGHQNRLGHYMRNLYTAYEYIDKSGMSRRDRYLYCKILRVRLSNYEQGILALNIISHMGASWEKSGLCSRYAPIKNIPELFFTFDRDFSMKDRFPDIKFEWEENNNKGFFSRSIRILGHQITVRRRN